MAIAQRAVLAPDVPTRAALLRPDSPMPAAPPEVPAVDPYSGVERTTLRFESDSLERRYQVVMRRESLAGFRLACLLGIGLWIGAGSLLVLLTDIDVALALVVVAGLAAINLGALLGAGWATTLNRQHGLATPVAIANALGALGLASAGGVLDSYAVSALILVQVFWFVAVTRFVFAAMRAVAIVGAFTAVVAIHPEPASRLLDLFLLLAATGGILVALYRLEAARRRVFQKDLLIAAKSRELEAEKVKTDSLLGNVLPAAVAAELLNEPRTLAEEAAETSVLFADLVGFTPLAARLSPAEVVRHLNEIFMRFDELAERHGVEKVKTIGDAYMAVGGLPIAQDDHALRVVRLGLDMIEATRAYADAAGLPLALRVGVHSGPVVAGVIGKARLSYDLWGDTVNVASRMEQHGLPDEVQVSAATWALVADSLRGEPRGAIALKGLGEMPAWIITGSNEAGGYRPADAAEGRTPGALDVAPSPMPVLLEAVRTA